MTPTGKAWAEDNESETSIPAIIRFGLIVILCRSRDRSHVDTRRPCDYEHKDDCRKHGTIQLHEINTFRLPFESTQLFLKITLALNCINEVVRLLYLCFLFLYFQYNFCIIFQFQKMSESSNTLPIGSRGELLHIIHGRNRTLSKLKKTKDHSW